MSSENTSVKNIIPIFRDGITNELLSELTAIVIEGFGGDQTVWNKRFRYWWHSNPYLLENIPACWIIRNEDEKIVAFHANIPTRFQRGDKIYSVIGSGTYYVSPSFRGPLSAALAVQPSRQKSIDFAIATTANEIANKIICSIGYHLVGGNIKINNYIIITSLSQFIAMGCDTIINKYKHSGIVGLVLVTGAKIGCAVSKIISTPTPKAKPSITSSSTHELHICNDASSFIKYISNHSKGDTIEFAKDETTIQWMLFSPEVKALRNRKVVQVFTKTDEYCGYFIYDIMAGNSPYIRLTEMKLLNPENTMIKLIIKYLKREAKNNGCTMVYSALQSPDSITDELLHKNILLCNKKNNNYYVKFRKNVITDVDPYSIYVPSSLDPDIGF